MFGTGCIWGERMSRVGGVSRREFLKTAGCGGGRGVSDDCAVVGVWADGAEQADQCRRDWGGADLAGA